KNSTDWGGFSFALAIVFMIVLNVFAAFVVRIAVSSGERAEAENQGKIVVSRTFWDAVNAVETAPRGSSGTPDEGLVPFYSSEAREIAERYGGKQDAIERKLRNAVREHGAREFVTRDDASPELNTLPKA